MQVYREIVGPFKSDFSHLAADLPAAYRWLKHCFPAEKFGAFCYRLPARLTNTGESVPCMQARGSKYDKCRIYADKHGVCHKSCSDCTLVWRISAFSAASESSLSLPQCLPPYLANGAPNMLSRSLASSSVRAVVTNAISMPRIFSTLSYSISGKINCSLRPRL